MFISTDSYLGAISWNFFDITFSVLLLLLSSILVGWSDWLTNIGGWIWLAGGLGFSPVVDWSPGIGSVRELFTLPCFIDDARDPRTKIGWSRTERFGTGRRTNKILKISDPYGPVGPRTKRSMDPWMTLGLLCMHPNSYDTIVLVGLMEYFFRHIYFLA